MYAAFLYFNSINWAQSLLDGLIQFIATVLLAFIITNSHQKKTNDSELSAILHDELEDYLFELFDHLGKLSSRTNYLQRQTVKSLENNTMIMIGFSEFMELYSIRERFGIISIKVKSNLSILERKKTIDPDLVNIFNKLINLTNEFHNVYYYNWLPNKTENPEYFYKHFNFNHDSTKFNDQIVEVAFNHYEFLQNNSLEIIFEKLVLSKYSYGITS